jgi:endonuclease
VWLVLGAAGRSAEVWHWVTLADQRLMRLVIARCTVDYSGRLTAHLPEATRLIMVKADGTLAIHSDGNASKPLNWMIAPNVLEMHADRWEVTNSKGERLQIWIHEILEDVTHDLGVDPGLVKDGVEAHLQELLAAAPDTLEEGLTLIRREYPTDIGPVDLLCADATGATVAVEIKRKGDIDGVEQLARYLERLGKDPRLAPVRGLFAAQSIAPQARVIAEARGIGAIEVDYDGLREAEDTELRLFDLR